MKLQEIYYQCRAKLTKCVYIPDDNHAIIALSLENNGVKYAKRISIDSHHITQKQIRDTDIAILAFVYTYTIYTLRRLFKYFT